MDNDNGGDYAAVAAAAIAAFVVVSTEIAY